VGWRSGLWLLFVVWRGIVADPAALAEPPPPAAHAALIAAPASADWIDDAANCDDDDDDRDGDDVALPDRLLGHIPNTVDVSAIPLSPLSDRSMGSRPFRPPRHQRVST